MVDMDIDAAPICDQLWPFVSKIIDEVVITMTLLLKFADAEEKIYHHFSILSLRQSKYCIHTFRTDAKHPCVIILMV